MSDSAIYGVDVVIFDGTNHEAIVRALGIEEGDGIAMTPGNPLLMKYQALQDLRFAASEGDTDD